MAAHTLNNARSISAKETSQIIRKSLKATFPATKFSVTTDRSGTINVRWTDGPTPDRVEAIASQFEGKGFDGMIDMQYYINGWMLDGVIIGTRCSGTVSSRGTVQPWGMVAPHDDCELVSFGAGFIFCNRTISPDLANRCIAQIAEYWGGVEVVPVAVPQYSGYKLEPDVGFRPIRDDLNGDWYSWHSAINQAASDRSKFTRTPIPEPSND